MSDEGGGDGVTGYEYLDHTADIQIHSWAPTLAGAFEQAILAMYGYMTDLTTVEIDESVDVQVEAEGHDLDSLLYSVMDEFLFSFSADYIVCKEIRIEEIDLENFKIRASGKGEEFDLQKHPQGTEVKAITYSNMQIHQSEGRAEVYVIIDI